MIPVYIPSKGRSDASSTLRILQHESYPMVTVVTPPAEENLYRARYDDSGWSMGLVTIARLNPALLLKYSECARLDPYKLSGAVTAALFEELVATASIMGQG